jgi:hypothetical protein
MLLAKLCIRETAMVLVGTDGNSQRGNARRQIEIERENDCVLLASCVQPITERCPSGQFARIALDLHSRHRNTTLPPAGSVLSECAAQGWAVRGGQAARPPQIIFVFRHTRHF